MYKQLQIIETEHDRAYALIKRRIDILVKIFKDLNHTAYNNYIMEISSELSAIYQEYHELRLS